MQTRQFNVFLSFVFNSLCFTDMSLLGRLSGSALPTEHPFLGDWNLMKCWRSPHHCCSKLQQFLVLKAGWLAVVSAYWRLTGKAPLQLPWMWLIAGSWTGESVWQLLVKAVDSYEQRERIEDWSSFLWIEKMHRQNAGEMGSLVKWVELRFGSWLGRCNAVQVPYSSWGPTFRHLALTDFGCLSISCVLNRTGQTKSFNIVPFPAWTAQAVERLG